MIAGGATNVIPDSVRIEGTFRAFKENWRATAKNRIREIARDIAAKYGVESDVCLSDGYPSVINSVPLARTAADLTACMFGKGSVVDLDLRTTAEDFGFYTRLYPSLFYRFGVGGSDPGNLTAGKLHTPSFNPDEKALEYAVAGMLNLVFNLTY